MRDVDLRSIFLLFFFFFKQKTAYELRISDWSSDVCSSDLEHPLGQIARRASHHADLAQGPVDRLELGVAHLLDHAPARPSDREIGRASCRERVCQYV